MSKTKYKEKRDHQYFFDFVCDGCGSEGELGIPIDMAYQQIGCPEDCGAVYILWHPPNEVAALQCVVCPVFEELPDQEPEQAEPIL